MEKELKGVVHVGAHKGEEVPEYIAQGRSPIILFEPQPLSWDKPLEVQLVVSALGDHTSRLIMRIPHDLHVTNELDTQSASGLALIPERAIANGWTPTRCGLLNVQQVRFDEWAMRNEFVLGSCSLLVIDVQGMELQVLHGFGAHLDGFEEIVVECSDPPLYEGGAHASAVVRFLAQRGFKQSSPVVAHGDIRFVKEVA